MDGWGAHIHKRDGFDLALALTPPTPRRGLLLCDPSYEVKDDYDRIPRIFAQIARKWNVGLLILWYPILRGAPHRAMVAALQDQHPDHLTHEVTFPPRAKGTGWKDQACSSSTRPLVWPKKLPA